MRLKEDDGDCGGKKAGWAGVSAYNWKDFNPNSQISLDSGR